VPTESAPSTRFPVGRGRIALTLALGALALVLGYIGFKGLPGSRTSNSDALFQAIQLFVLESSVRRPSPELDVARFLAPAVTALATIGALFTLLKNEAERTRVGLFATKHVVVAGLGATGSRVCAALLKDHSVVAIEKNRQSPRIPTTRERGARVIIGDATDPETLRAARIERASEAIFLTGDDSTNLRAVAAAKSVLEQGTTGPSTMHVAVSDVSSWIEMSRLQLTASPEGTWTEYFNLDDRTARSLVSEAMAGDPSRLQRVVMVGDVSVVARAATHIIRRARRAAIKPDIFLLGEAGERLAAGDPTFETWTRANQALTPISERDLSELTPAPTLLIVCGAERRDVPTISQAVSLSRSLPGTPAVVSIYGEGTEAALGSIRPDAANIKLVPAKTAALADELREQGSVELLARARHNEYRQQQLSRGDTPESNRSLVAWEALPDSLKNSNRDWARSVSSALAGLGAELRPLTTATPTTELTLSDAQLELLANAEHDRWVRDLRDRGWRIAPDGRKDPEAKLHPLLVPWEELSAAEREKDRDGFTALPAMLADIGYELVFEDAGAE
jgi:hypothetical protein